MKNAGHRVSQQIQVLRHARERALLFTSQSGRAILTTQDKSEQYKVACDQNLVSWLAIGNWATCILQVDKQNSL